MIRTHAALPKAAEAHLAGGEVYDGIVNTAAAKAAARGEFSGGFPVARKDVESQGMGHGIDFPDGFIHGIISKDGKQRTENLFLHHGVSEVYGIHDGRFYFQAFSVCISSADDFVPVHQAEDALKMFSVYDFAVVRVCKRVFPKLFLNLPADFSKQFVFDAFVTVQIVGSDAGLPAV